MYAADSLLITLILTLLIFCDIRTMDKVILKELYLPIEDLGKNQFDDTKKTFQTTPKLKERKRSRSLIINTDSLLH